MNHRLLLEEGKIKQVDKDLLNESDKLTTTENSDQDNITFLSQSKQTTGTR